MNENILLIITRQQQEDRSFEYKAKIIGRTSDDNNTLDTICCSITVYE